MYDCKFCDKTFKTKKGQDYHLSKNVCQKEIYVCDLCKKSFANKSGKIYHINNKVCIDSTMSVPMIGYDLSSLVDKKVKIKLKMKKQNEYIRNLETENCFLKGKIQALEENPVTQIDKQQINNIYLEVPPAFLTLDTFPTLIQGRPLLDPLILNWLKGGLTGVSPVPIFNSAQITNKKDPYAKISDGEKYIYAPKKHGETPLTPLLTVTLRKGG